MFQAACRIDETAGAGWTDFTQPRGRLWHLRSFDRRFSGHNLETQRVQPFIDFLQENPLVAVALVIVVLLIVLSVMKKLFKIALVLIVIFLIAGGTVFHISQREIADKGKELLQKAGETAKEKIGDFADSAKVHLTGDTAKTKKARKK
jgi:hypothetical protein